MHAVHLDADQHLLLMPLGNGSDSAFANGWRGVREGRSSQTTVTRNLMKALKFLVSSGRNFSSMFITHTGEYSLCESVHTITATTFALIHRAIMAS